ncbi:GxGYxYP domain-containing protein [Nonomuraea sp. N2-4H]|uniref:GxGYxYP domain-containing protein n=1 Tax=Nonomuraea sp. N2-4H TaxID=3128898 RepID=UPI00324EDDFE
MVSRREFLLANGTVLAAGALGLSFPAAPASASAPATAPLLPGFGRPTRLDYADIATLHGNDQLLLTTLQGVVNRRRPRLYFNYNKEGFDERWLSSTGAAVTRHERPLDLVARYRGEVRGAILIDPDVPDSVNVATTLAGLENAVAATAEQAEEYRLKVITDLRGRFDPDDVLATYRWQLDELFPAAPRPCSAACPRPGPSPSRASSGGRSPGRPSASGTPPTGRCARSTSARSCPARRASSCASRTRSATTAGARPSAPWS